MNPPAAVQGPTQIPMWVPLETGYASPRAARAASCLPLCGDIARGNCSALIAARRWTGAGVVFDDPKERDPSPGGWQLRLRDYIRPGIVLRGGQLCCTYGNAAAPWQTLGVCIADRRVPPGCSWPT